MGRASALCGAAAAAVLGTGVVSATGAAPAGQDVTRAETHRFAVSFSPFFFTDLDENGRPSKGDSILFHDLLFADGQQVGQQGGSCPIVSDDPVLASCTGTIELPNGQIAFQFLNSPPPRKRIAVTGGTGRFQNVRGEGILVESATAQDRDTLTLRLLP